jgi:nitrate reductase NapE component
MALAGIFVGAAVSRASVRSSHRRNPERANTVKWILFCIFLSVGIILAMIAVFVSGPVGIVDWRLRLIAGVAAALSFCATRFKKALGIPILVLLLACMACIGLFLQSIHAFTGETTIATVRIISANDESMRLELIPRDGEPVLLNLEGDYFAPIVKVVIFDDLLVFLGAKTWYRFDGVTSFKLVKEDGEYRFRQGSTDFYFHQPPGISEVLWRLFEANEKRIPGIRTVQVEMDLKKPNTQVREFATYDVVVRNNGGVEIVPRS